MPAHKTLSPEDIQTMQDLQRQGLTQRRIAAQLGISPEAVRGRMQRLRNAEADRRGTAGASMADDDGPLVQAQRALRGAAQRGHAPGTWRLRGRLLDNAGLVRAANAVLAAAGHPPIPYPGVAPVVVAPPAVRERAADGRRLPPCRWTPETAAELVRRDEAGEGPQEIAAAMGLRVAQVATALNRLRYDGLAGVGPTLPRPPWLKERG